MVCECSGESQSDSQLIRHRTLLPLPAADQVRTGRSHAEVLDVMGVPPVLHGHSGRTFEEVFRIGLVVESTGFDNLDNVAKSGMTDPQIALRYAEERLPRFVVDRANGSTFSFIYRANDARDKCEAIAFRMPGFSRFRSKTAPD